MPFSTPSPPTLFQTYLFPTLPFRNGTQRRQSSVSSSSSSSYSSSSSSPPSASAPAPPPLPEPYLNTHASHLKCTRCLADLADSSQIISKGFTGRHGRAYLVSPPSSSSSSSSTDPLPNLPNTFTHKPVPRQLVTGAHTVADIACAHCGSVLGWKYVAAAEEAQKYKVGKVILETRKVCRSSTWERKTDGDELLFGEVEGLGGGGRGGGGRGREEVEFDSQDEDECEDLFLGIWTPGLAGRRRRERRLGRVGED